MPVNKWQNLGMKKLSELQESVQSDDAKAGTKQSGSRVLFTQTGLDIFTITLTLKLSVNH